MPQPFSPPPLKPPLRGDRSLSELAAAGLEQRLTRLQQPAPAAPEAHYRARLAEELASIRREGVADAFLAAWNFVTWAQEQDLHLAPGFGCTPSSLVAFALGITEIDPLAHGLIFERFLNSESPGPLVFQILVGLPHGGPGAENPEEPTAAGVDGLDGIQVQVQVESQLSVLAGALQLLRQNRPEADPLRLLEQANADPAAYELLRSPQGRDVLFLPDAELLQAVQSIQPASFEELTAALALGCPGPMEAGLLKDYLDRKSGRALSQAPHPLCGPILSDTHGLPIFQEQIMEIAVEVAGFTWEQANSLRRALGKKAAHKVQEHLGHFLHGAFRRHQMAKEDAGLLFAGLESLAPFAFSKAHAVACALLSCQAAFLATHFRAEWEESVRRSSPQAP